MVNQCKAAQAYRLIERLIVSKGLTLGTLASVAEGMQTSCRA